MKDLENHKPKKIEGPEILIIIMMVIVGLLAILISEVEVKLICAILFVIGGFILFMSFSNKAKDLYQREKFPSELNEKNEEKSIDSISTIQEQTSQHKKISSNGSLKTAVNEDFFIVKQIPNNKNNVSNLGILNNNKTEILAKSESKSSMSSNIAHLFDIESKNRFLDIDPKAEFSDVLLIILNIVKQVTFANTVSFFWVNLESEQIIFESCVTDSKQFMLKKKEVFSLAENLMGRVANLAKPEIITEVNTDAEKDLLGYYSSNEFVKSILGLPIFYEDSIVGVLIIDSKDEDAYGEETITQISGFINLISNFIKSSTEKYDYYIDSKILNRIVVLQQELKSIPELNDFFNYSLELLNSFFVFDFATICYFDHDSEKITVGKVKKVDENHNYVNSDDKVEQHNSIIGKVIIENKIALIKDLSILEIPRFNNEEKILSFGSFLAVPICSSSKIFGAISIESCKTNQYTLDEINILKKICDGIANLYEILVLKKYISKNLTIDSITKLPKKEYFFNQLNSALSYIKDNNAFGAFILFQLDKKDELLSRYSIQTFNKVIYAVVAIINTEKAIYQILGIINDNILGLVLLNYTLDEGKVFAEKIRKLVANNVIHYENKSFSVTVSAGVSEIKKPDDIADVIENSSKALRLAFEEGGNRVKIL